MSKFYSAVILLVLIFSGFCLHAQNVSDNKSLLDLVRKNAAQLNLSPADADNVTISHSFTDSKTNIQYVYLQQTYQQIKVYNSIKTVLFRNNELVYSAGKFVESLAEKAGAGLVSPAVQAEQAINNAAMHLKLPVPLGLRNIENKFTTEKKMIFSPAGIAKNSIETELLWVAADDGSWVKLAWNVNIDERRSSDWWNVRIDATTGAFLEKNNWTVHEGQPLETDAIETTHYQSQFIPGIPENNFRQQPVSKTDPKGLLSFLPPPTVTSADYYVAPLPFESPRHGPMALVNNPWLAAGAANNAITHGWHFDGTTNYPITRGNNVHAYLDIANSNNPASGANTPVVSTTPDPLLTFNFVPNFTQQPAFPVNRQAAVTNLFYMNNKIHDILYQYGFNESSGNFQADNIGRGGVAGDYVRAEAQDGGGTNNANFSTPADGGTPRMQMYLWTGVPGFTVNTPPTIAGPYFATESGFSTNNRLINVGPVTAQVVWYNDNALPNPTHFACNGSTPGSLAGKIAMIIRGGGCVGGFVEKVKNAQNNGAVAVIMVNNVPGLPIAMGGTDNTITIPAVMISDVNGALLASEFANNVNVTLTAGVGLDGDFDNGIITHEYGHGVSNRLTGGAPNAGCLGNQEQGGEGWSDYLGLMLTHNWATANLTDGSIPRPIGCYALGHPLGQGGIRTAPYSTNMVISPQSYINLPTFVVPHGIGEVWCSAIWDMTWNVIQQEGVINPNLYDANGVGGNVIALKLVMEGMRLQTCRPGFLDGRDAILAADSILYNSRHKCAIWNAFARRGMGLSANQGSSNSSTDGTGATDIPSLVKLNKTATPLTVVQGELVAVNITATCECVTNTNYTLRDTIPAGFNYVSSTGGTLSGNVVTFSNLNFNTPQASNVFTVVIQPTNPGCAITVPINDNRDGSTIGGLTSVIAAGTTNWVTSTTRSASPTTSWFAASTAANKDFSLTSPGPGFTAGNQSIFSFRQYYITENTIDGGRVEYSVNNGANWLDAGPFILQNGYNKAASVAPWGAGQRIFSGVSFGRGSGQFINTIVDLSSLSGQSVRVRLRSRSNAANSGTYEGWFVDDLIQRDGCGGIVKAGLYDGSAVRVDSLASPVFITPGTPIAITLQPNNIAVCDGNNAVFTSAATPATNPTYQWQRSTDAGVTWTNLAGETNATLTVTGVTLAMNGYQYRVIAYSSLSSGFVISNPATLTVTPMPSATIVYPSSPYCQNAGTANVTRTGTAGGTYSSTAGLTINATTGAITLGTSTPGTYTVTYTIAAAGGCPTVTTSTTITITPTPSATISYAGSPHCSTDLTAPITRTGTGGGTYSATPAGLTINATTGTVTPNTSTPGTYTVTYTVPASGGCAIYSTTTTITITQAPNMIIFYLGNPYCSNAGTATVSQFGTPGGTYSAAPAGLTINAATGAVTLGTSTPGTYTVTYSIPPSGGCGITITTTTITITPAPAATISYTGSPYCSNAGTANVTRTGTAGGTYSSTTGLTINATTGAVTLGTSTPGTYTVTYTIPASGGCATFTTTSTITITALPAAIITYAGSPYCANAGTATVTRTGTAGGVYSSTAGLTINAATGDVNLGTSTPGTYTVTYTIAAGGGCPVVAFTTTITITTLPAATISYAGNPYCQNAGTANVTRTGTAGGTYSAAPAGLTINATTGAITLGTSTPGTYTVTYTLAAGGGCPAVTATTSITVSSSSVAPTAATASPAVLCGSSTVTLSVTGGSLGSGATWRWYSGTCGGTLVGTGATLNVTVSATTTYFVRAEGTCNTTTCASVTVTVNTQPTITIAASPRTSLMPFQTTTLTATVTPADPTNTTIWYRNGNVVAGATSLSLVVGIDALGLYTARTTTTAGCTALSNAVLIKDSINNILFITPNPNNGRFQVRFYSGAQQLGFVRHLVMFAENGQRVFDETYPITAPYSSMDINARHLSKGTYIVMLTDAFGKEVLATGKVVLQ